jgi:hypothetical protein
MPRFSSSSLPLKFYLMRMEYACLTCHACYMSHCPTQSLYMYVCMYVCVWNVCNVCVYVCMHACMCVYVYVCM